MWDAHVLSGLDAAFLPFILFMSIPVCLADKPLRRKEEEKERLSSYRGNYHCLRDYAHPSSSSIAKLCIACLHMQNARTRFWMKHLVLRINISEQDTWYNHVKSSS